MQESILVLHDITAKTITITLSSIKVPPLEREGIYFSISHLSSTFQILLLYNPVLMLAPRT